ncbi:CidA/LrgA family protein [Paraglaciecola sp. 2405UD69-4]|uniref:CidA/LrgA family protein n=1 Tax=Paraglaciecola sp. 2405UD69-4 TaxID=3391836 RepID=UPI0039C9B783
MVILQRTVAILKLALCCLVLILCWAAGYGLSLVIALPPALLGLFILFIGLAVIGHVPKDLLDVCQFLLRHFSLFFVPPLIAAWVYVETLQQQLWLFLMAIVASTFLSFLITSWLARRFLPADTTADKESDNG